MTALWVTLGAVFVVGFIWPGLVIVARDAIHRRLRARMTTSPPPNLSTTEGDDRG